MTAATLNASRPLHYGRRVDATGSRRRLQALMVLGWSQAKLATHLGLPQQHVNVMFTAGQVNASTARAVARLYDELWDTTPARVTRHDKASVAQAKRYAAERGWLPPLAWDDGSIDDPLAGPGDVAAEDLVDEVAVERLCAGRSTARDTRDADRDAAIRALATRGISATGIARRLRTSHRVIHNALRTEVAA